MEDFMTIDIAEAIVLSGVGLAMSLDSDSQMFYALLLMGTVGKEFRKVEMNIIIPPDATQQFVDVIKAMESRREESL